MIIPARSISSDLVDLINGEAIKGMVHSLFDHACNIKLENGRIMAVITPRLANYPSAIKLDTEDDYNLRHFGIRVGTGITLNVERIMFDGVPAFIDLTRAGVWDASLSFAKPEITRERLKKNLEEIKKITLSSGNRDGLVSVLDRKNANNIAGFVLPIIDKLAIALKRQDYGQIKEVSRGLVGFGPGLTPSADDFLLGIMASLYYIGNFYGCSLTVTKLLTGSMVSDIGGRTTIVSEVMLRNGAKGLFHEPLRNLMLAVTSKTEVRDRCMALLNIGGTSGSDCASGVVYGGLIIPEMNGVKEAQQCL
jgi:hypothetical protein